MCLHVYMRYLKKSVYMSLSVQRKLSDEVLLLTVSLELGINLRVRNNIAVVFSLSVFSHHLSCCYRSRPSREVVFYLVYAFMCAKTPKYVLSWRHKNISARISRLRRSQKNWEKRKCETKLTFFIVIVVSNITVKLQACAEHD